MEYRFIEGEELSKIVPILEKFGWSPLHPTYSKALIAEEEGEIKGFLVLQAVLRTEPMYVSPECRGRTTGIAKELASQMTAHLKENGVNVWYCQADNPYVVELCEENGMVQVESPTYKMG
jgi:hypothetical protein